MPNDDTIFLKTSVDAMSFFNEEQLRRVTPDIEHRNYSKGETVLFRGEITSGLYVIKRGKVEVLKKDKAGNLQRHELIAGDFFGEMSVLEEIAATASVRATEDGTEVLTIPHGSLGKLLEMQPLLKKALLDKAAARKKTL